MIVIAKETRQFDVRLPSLFWRDIRRIHNTAAQCISPSFV